MIPSPPKSAPHYTARSMKIRFALSAILVAGLFISGCADSTQLAEVTGTVLINGELAKNGSVTFHPVVAGPAATGSIFSDGSYSIRVGQGNRKDPDKGLVPPGDYKVTVFVSGPPGPPSIAGGPPSAGPRLTASKYQSVDSTPLKFTVTPGKNLFVLELDPALPGDDVAEAIPAADAASPEGAAEEGATPPEGAVPDSPVAPQSPPGPEATPTTDEPVGEKP